MLACAPVSALVGMCLPGRHATLLSQEVRFLRPVRVGEALVLHGRVTDKSEATRAIIVAFVIRGRETGKAVAQGEAHVLVGSPPRQGVSMDELKAMDFWKEFRGAVVLVTGASRGIGEATAKLFGHHGARVVVNYFQGKDDAEAIAEEIRQSGADALAIGADIRRRDDVERMVSAAVARFGTVDILVNNAVGRVEPVPFQELTWDGLCADVELIVGGAVNCIQAVLPLMLKAGHGRIVNITTTYTGAPPARYAGYVTAKSALLGLTRSLAVEYGRKGILVNAVCPGITETDLLAGLPEHAKERASDSVPLGRLAEPLDVAKAVVMVASRYADYINGHQLVVSGGGYLT
jgi:3-oxoacyl-[acyl-carrier protein] reductase